MSPLLNYFKKVVKCRPQSPLLFILRFEIGREESLKRRIFLGKGGRGLKKSFFVPWKLEETTLYFIAFDVFSAHKKLHLFLQICNSNFSQSFLSLEKSGPKSLVKKLRNFHVGWSEK